MTQNQRNGSIGICLLPRASDLFEPMKSLLHLRKIANNEQCWYSSDKK